MINPVTVSQAARWMAKGLGLKWPEDRIEIIDGLNKARNFMYNLEFSADIFSDVFHCIQVSTFCQPCVTRCGSNGQYQGISIPNNMDSVESAWEYGIPLKVRSNWREASAGIELRGSYPRVELVEVAQQFPTERSLKSVSYLKVYAECDEDTGKHVIIDVIDCDRRPAKLDFTLEADGWNVVNRQVSEIVSVALPEGLRGGVTLAQQDGYVLSIYEPWETIPSYKRYRIGSKCQAGSVFVQGRRNFRPIWFDSDIFEVGDQLVVEAAGRMFRYGEGSTDAKDVARSQLDKTTLLENLKGAIARKRGGAIQDGPITRTSRSSAFKSLPGYQR